MLLILEGNSSKLELWNFVEEKKGLRINGMADDPNAQVCLNINQPVKKSGKVVLKFMKVFQKLNKV